MGNRCLSRAKQARLRLLFCSLRGLTTPSSDGCHLGDAAEGTVRADIDTEMPPGPLLGPCSLFF